MPTIAVDHRSLERCLQFAGLRGVTVGGPFTHGTIPGLGFIQVERAPWDRRGRAVFASGLTDNDFYANASRPGWSIRGSGCHRSVWRFAQICARKVFKLQEELRKMTDTKIMTRDEIRAAIQARRDGQVAGPRTFNALADAIGVNRSTMRAALSVGPLSRPIAKKCTAYFKSQTTAAAGPCFSN